MSKSGFLKGAMILTVAGVIVKIMGAVNKILISRLLGGEGIGLYQMAYPIYSITTGLVAAGIPIALSIMVAEKRAKNDLQGVQRLVRVSFVTLALLGAFFGLIMYQYADWLVTHGWILDPRAVLAVKALAPVVPVVTMLGCLRGYFQGFQNMLPTGVSQIGEQLLRVVTMFGFSWYLLDRGLHYAAAGAAFSNFPGALGGLCIVLFFYIKQRRHASQPTLSEKKDPIVSIIKRLFILAIPVSLANIMIPIMATIDLLIVPRRLVEAGFSITEATTMYGYLTGMANSLISLPIILTTSLAASLVPAISEAHALQDRKGIMERAQTAMKIASLITLPAWIGLFVLATPISAMLFDTTGAASSIAIISASVFLLGIQQVTTGVLQGLGRTAIPMYNLAFSAILKILLSWVLTAIPWLNVQGAAIATNVDFGVAALLNLGFLFYFIKYKPNWFELGSIFLSAILMGVCAWAMFTFLETVLGNVGALLLSMVVALVVYISALLGMKIVSRADLLAMPVIGKRIKR